MPAVAHQPSRTDNCETPESRAIREHAAAMIGVGVALERIADVIEAATEQRAPADEFYAGATTRLNALCKWLSGKWPWVFFAGGTVLFQTITEAPEKAPALINSLAALVRAMGAGA